MYLKKEQLLNLIKEELDAVLSEEIIDEAEICAAGKNYVDGKTIGGQRVSRGKDGKFNNWSARAAQIASKYCKDPNYGRGKSKKNEALNEGSLSDWEKENWTHSDGTPCGGGKKDGSQSRCKPASKWKTMSKSEKAADNAKKKAGTKAGKQYVPATKKGKVTKSHTKRNEDLHEVEITDDEKEELEDVSKQLKGAVKAHGKQAKTIDKAIKNEEKKKKKKPCKKAKGKRYVKRVNGRCRSFGQAGKAKGGGDRIRPGTKKGDAYCARSAKIKKCKNPPCANDLSRKKWKCRGSKSMREQNEGTMSPYHDKLITLITSGEESLKQALELFSVIKGTGMLQPHEEDHIQRLSEYADVQYRYKSVVKEMSALRKKFGVAARSHKNWRKLARERVAALRSMRELEQNINPRDKRMIAQTTDFA